MKNKLLLFLLFHLLLGNKLSAKNLVDVVNSYNVNLELVTTIVSSDTIKKYKKTSKFLRTIALLSPPSTTAGSTCGDGINPVQVNVYAFGNNNSETIEWFISQTSVSPIYIGTVYSPSIITTKTYYVRSRSGSDVSTRIPVVASVYFAPPAVTLTASPANNTTNPLCLGTSVTFTASGGADLFEFSVDGVVMQAMSTSKIFTTSVLTDGQVVRVRTRYAVVMDGVITEKTWGTGVLEDNFLSAPLSANASNGYVNSLKISASEDKLVFGVAGKVSNNRSLLLFLDTKPGGFSLSNYGDEADLDPLVRSFNLFNTNPSIFDSYFQADYCLVISTDRGETNYYANVIELKTGTSIKTYLGSAATGFPSSIMGVNKNNIGINDYNLGFEVEVLKSLIGYTTGDIKFFAFTMNDKEDGSQTVTNSFLSPERTSNLDYGIGSVDYNLKDPNPVVVSSAALTPCYSEANVMMNFVSVPTGSVTQPTCSIQSGTIVIDSQPGVEYSIDGLAYKNSNVFSGLAPDNYTLYVRKTTDNTCVTSSTSALTINAIPITPSQPILSSVTQPTCSSATGSFTITNYNASFTYAASPSAGVTISGNTVTAPFGNYTVTAILGVCTSIPSGSNTVNAQPITPSQPTLSSVTQPNCSNATGSFIITNYNGSYTYSVNPSLGVSISGNTVNAPFGTYTVTATLGVCSSTSVSNTVNAQPVTPSQPTLSSVTQPTCSNATGSFSITNYNASYTYAASPSAGVTISGNTVTAPFGNYIVTASLGACTSTPSGSNTVNAQPITPSQPALSSVTQPTCSSATGSFTITNYNGSYTYSVNPSLGVSISGNTVTAPFGTYTITATLGVCSSTSVSSTVNAPPITPSQPTLSSVTHPTCSIATGSFTITNYNASYTYAVSPSAGVTISGNTVTAPFGNYTLTASLGVCTSTPSGSNTVNAQPSIPTQPTLSSVTQPTCSSATGSFTITNYNVSYTYSVSPSLGVSVSGNTVTALGGDYTVTATIGLCTLSTSVTINTQPITPSQPTLSSVTQPTCSSATGSFTITNYNASYTYAASPSVGVIISANTVTAPFGNYTVTASLGVCTSTPSGSNTVNAQPSIPTQPTLSSVIQPTCSSEIGNFIITNYNVSYTYSVSPSLGVSISGNSVIAPSGNYTVTATLGLCKANTEVIINPIPPQIQFEISGDCESKDYVLTASAIAGSYNSNNVDYQWKDSTGAPVGTNSNILNVSEVIVSSPGQEVFPVKYSLTIKSTATGCETTNIAAVESIYCNIQKGISPDGNGSNDYFDLRVLDVKKLEIFNRYGIKVYSQSNYTDQWKGQTDKGDELPSATYYYVIEFNNGEIKTGWIYLIREK
ncbi:gliding motility-associated C-terminal domain-containing protein [Flavobacterium sp. LB3P122]|uniref:T9SS type B sorting domain-containing protein n=1 Tax=Flavobacterium algoriphilum TaxID=3398738 RepID=UPI003A838844